MSAKLGSPLPVARRAGHLAAAACPSPPRQQHPGPLLAAATSAPVPDLDSPGRAIRPRSAKRGTPGWDRGLAHAFWEPRGQTRSRRHAATSSLHRWVPQRAVAVERPLTASGSTAASHPSRPGLCARGLQRLESAPLFAQPLWAHFTVIVEPRVMRLRPGDNAPGRCDLI